MFNEPFEGVGHAGAYARLGGLDGGRLLWRRALERPDDVVPVARPFRMLSAQRLLFGLGLTLDRNGRELPKWKAEHERPGKGCKEGCVIHSRLLELPIWGQVLSLICARHLGNFQLLQHQRHLGNLTGCLHTIHIIYSDRFPTQPQKVSVT